jgi:hypothetical protein
LVSEGKLVSEVIGNRAAGSNIDTVRAIWRSIDIRQLSESCCSPAALEGPLMVNWSDCCIAHVTCVP